MLLPDNRVVLMDQLRPPVGYRLDSAVATTFTLQLSAALVPPLAFAARHAQTGADPVAVLESVRATADRIDVFCQAGQIVVPRKASDLMAFLETMIHPVRPPRPGHLFHPKIWFARYVADGQPDVFRLLCLTRNLTDSQAWDGAVTLEGTDTGTDRSENAAFVALLKYLPKCAVAPLPAERAARVEQLARAASRIDWSPPPGCQGVQLHALGVPGIEPMLDYSGLRHLVISPFCNDDGLRHVTGGGNKQTIVVAEPEALDAASPELLNKFSLGGADGSVFVLSAEAELPHEEDQDLSGEEMDTPGEKPQLGELAGLHAKITVIEKNYKAHLILGSANATSAAFGGNVEFVVEMVGSTKNLGIDTLIKRGTKGEPRLRDLLQEYTPGERSDLPDELDAEEVLRNLLRRLASVPITTRVTSDGDNYRLHLLSESELDLPEGVTLDATLLTQPGHTHQHPGTGRLEGDFSGIALADISPFVVLRLMGVGNVQVSSVIHTQLLDAPGDRLDAILARQVDTREKFLRFVALLLGLADADTVIMPEGTGAAMGGWGEALAGNAGILELVVSALAERPAALRDLDRLVVRLEGTPEGRAILPEGFEDLWANVTGALGSLGDTHDR